MSAPTTLKPDPSSIGGINKAPYALLPNLSRVFTDRARRFKILAENSRLSPYLEFLSGICEIQNELAGSLSPVTPIPPEQVERARENAMPPLDLSVMADLPDYRQTLERFLDMAQALSKPEPAAEALKQVREADTETLDWIIGNVMDGNLPVESLAHHLYVSAATQVYAARLAAGVDATRLVPIRIGICPVCGGKPVASMIIGIHGAEGARYASCSFCSTLWNEVRVKCLACGSTKGVGYRSVAAEDDSDGEDATVKAEICDTCNSWIKILYQNKNPSLDAIADDVASVGLDMLMKDTDYKRAGFDPFLVGY